MPPENHHLTLRFIGETPKHRAEEIDTALAALRAPGFPLTLAGVGCFAKGGSAVSLWAGVERNPALDHLQSKIETALQRAGLDPERRRFTPHVTLARLDNVPRPSSPPSCRRTICSAPSRSRSRTSRCSARGSARSSRSTRPRWNTS